MSVSTTGDHPLPADSAGVSPARRYYRVAGVYSPNAAAIAGKSRDTTWARTHRAAAAPLVFGLLGRRCCSRVTTPLFNIILVVFIILRVATLAAVLQCSEL